MKFAIFTLVEHIEKGNKLYGYAPYIREMDIWTKYVDEVMIVAPRSKSTNPSAIDLPYNHPKITYVEIPNFHFKSFFNVLRILIISPYILVKMFNVMSKSDHLHFRSPSNVAAIAALVQVFFPSKKKTVKYAGNWDPRSNQPIGYGFQKWIFGNSFFTKNMKVLVYGNWKNQSKYVNPFISATYKNEEKISFVKRDYKSELQFAFAGALVIGKRPLMTIKIIELLNKSGVKSKLHMYGEGIMRDELENYIHKNNLQEQVKLYGNQEKQVLRDRLKTAHFTILPSKSEGWPKAIAEGMFYGAIPISTKISCLEWMLNYGERGILIEPNVKSAVDEIEIHLKSSNLDKMAEDALNWSQQYTLETLEEAIKKTILS